MLGQHPQLYGLPETSLFCAETIGGWAELCQSAEFPMAHGLLRTIAEVCFGEQTERSTEQARGWLRRRSHMTTGLVFELIAERVAPRILVDKSPSVVFRLESMRRAQSMFPQARFIHLLRHPRGYAESVVKAMREAATRGPIPGWLQNLSGARDLAIRPGDGALLPPANGADPQRTWLALQRNICGFLETVPASRQLAIRGEALLSDPERGLREIAQWLGLCADADAIDAMMHPERSPFACFGPPGARYGNDEFFLARPALRPEQAVPQQLAGPLSWRPDGAGFSEEVRRLAQRFGYS
jgi:hypothetical protein